jgi:hypothetical protein
MRKFYSLIVFGYLIFTLSSCFSSHLTTQNQLKQAIPQSQFADAESVGMKKEDIIKKFGLPLSTSVEVQKDVRNEDLHYVEVLGDIKLFTTITLQNGIAVKQKADQITSNYDDQFKKIEKDLKILKTPRLYN